MANRRKPQYEGPWRKVRAQILQRDNYRCQIKGYGCLHEATEVDHILPVSMGGEWFDDSNLRASCRPCNLARNVKHQRTASRAW